MYLFRLDDASDYMDVAKWQRAECIFDKYGVKPLVGIIPENHDPKFVNAYERDDGFWVKAKMWQAKGWTLALHGWHHVYTTRSGGINPVNKKSEFAGVPLEQQRNMIKDAINILSSHGINPKIFFAPSHTYDESTLEALRLESDIRVISDTVANDVYYRDGFHFVPVQSGKCRKLPFKVVTICLHPNVMSDEELYRLDAFLKENEEQLLAFSDVELNDRKRSVCDVVLQQLYFFIKRIKV